MPELPEVETVVRQLRGPLVGRRLLGAHVLWRRSIARPSAAAFVRGVTGRRIVRMGRRGKYFVIELDDSGPGRLIVGHLRMSGRLFVDDDPRPPWARVTFPLDDGRHLVFVDVRKFGRLALVHEAEQAMPPMGPEPLSRVVDGDWMAAALATRRRRLKPLLLDQSFLAGLGNIYVDEALHRARLHPLQVSDRVAGHQARALADAIRAVLTEAIAKQGSSFDGFYRTPEGRPGSYQDEFAVYGRAGEPCPRCRASVRRIVVGQRGTHLCPRCQRTPRVAATGPRRRRTVR